MILALLTDHWVHDLDPVAVQIYGDFGIRWYGLAYLLGFVAAILLLRRYYKRGLIKLNPEDQNSLMFAMILGVLIGGRVGHVLLYSFPKFLDDPITLIRVWEGGMASHGGFVGVIVATWWFARRHKMTFYQLGDIIVSITPPGLLLGRIANFINGELWGTVSNASWAVIFPASAPYGTPVELIPPRHPSQLYEAALEGLFLLLYTQLRVWKGGALKRPGSLAGEFLALYAIVRIVGEQFREPDASLIFGMNRGVFYSIFFIIIGIAMVVHARKKSAELTTH